MVFFGWRQLPPEYPLHQHQDDQDPNNITNWVHKRFTHNDYIDQKLYDKDNFNQVYNINLLLEQDSDDSSQESCVDESFFG